MANQERIQQERIRWGNRILHDATAFTALITEKVEAEERAENAVSERPNHQNTTDLKKQLAAAIAHNKALTREIIALRVYIRDELHTNP